MMDARRGARVASRAATAAAVAAISAISCTSARLSSLLNPEIRCNILEFGIVSPSGVFGGTMKGVAGVVGSRCSSCFFDTAETLEFALTPRMSQALIQDSLVYLAIPDVLFRRRTTSR